MANFEGFGEDSPSQSRRPGLENMSERVQLISYSIYDELEVFVDSFGRDAGHGFIVKLINYRGNGIIILIRTVKAKSITPTIINLLEALDAEIKISKKLTNDLDLAKEGFRFHS